MIESIKKLTRMSVPIVSARFVSTLTTFILMLMLAQLGHTILAASLLISIVRITIMLTFLSPLFATGAVIGRIFGERNIDALPTALHQAMALGILLSTPCMLLYGFVETWLTWLNQPSDVVPYVGQFLHITLWTLPAAFMIVPMQQFLAGIKKAQWVTYSNILFLAVSLISGYLMIFGGFGIPAMGIVGAAWSVVISAWLLLAFMIPVTIKVARKQCGISLLPIRLNTFEVGKLITRIGTPIAMQIGSEMIVLIILTIMIGWLGDLAMGASQISNEYMMFAIVPIFGVAEASAVVIGHAYGEKNWSLIGKLGNATILTAIILSVIIALIFLCFHRSLIHAFLDHNAYQVEAIYNLALMLLSIRIISMLFDAIADVLTGSLRGLYDTAYPMWVGIITNWALCIPLAALFAFTLNWGVVGIVIGGGLARVVAAFWMLWRWYQKSHPRNFAQV